MRSGGVAAKLKKFGVEAQLFSGKEAGCTSWLRPDQCYNRTRTLAGSSRFTDGGSGPDHPAGYAIAGVLAIFAEFERRSSGTN